MMIDPHLAQVLTAPAELPRKMTQAQVTIRFAPDQHTESEAAALHDLVTTLLPLYQAGFLSADSAAAPDAKATIALDTAHSAVLTLGGLAHAPVMLQGLLRLIWLTYQTPAGALEQLAQLLGSLEEATEIFSPRSFSDVVKAVTVTARGDGQTAFDDLTLSRGPDYATLVTRVAALSGQDLTIAANGPLTLPQHVEHAFLTAHGAGLFGDPPPLTRAEPELWVTPQGQTSVLHVHNYDGDASYLVELLNVLLDGDVSTLAKPAAA